MAAALVDPGTSADDALGEPRRSNGGEARSRVTLRPPHVRTARFATESCTGVAIQPQSDFQAAIDAHAPGTTFCIKPGVHRLTGSLRPKEGQRFIGEPGAVVSGAKVVSSWTPEGSFWVATGQTQQSSPAGECESPSYTGCRYAEGVFLDGTSLWQVTDLAELSSGEFYFDYPNDRIYLADNPTGHSVEASVVREMFDAWGVYGVEVRGLIVEKFANPAQTPALNSREDWVLIGNEVRLNHGVGLAAGSQGVVRGNYVHHQGQLGMSGNGSVGALVEHNEIAFNNTGGFKISWEAGGGKWVDTRRLTVRRNWVHDNHGRGLWTDINNIDTTYARNRVEDNAGAGIMHEISYRATIHHNYIARNGSETESGLDGSGILVASSPNVEVYSNTLDRNTDGLGLRQDNRGSGSHGRYVARNFHAHHNVIIMCQGYTGAQTSSGPAVYRKRNNRFEKNRYRVGSPGGDWWYWRNAPRTVQEWKGYGHDRKGVFRLVAC